jgi:hypothetical protein
VVILLKILTPSKTHWKVSDLSRAWWHVPVAPATKEAETRGLPESSLGRGGGGKKRGRKKEKNSFLKKEEAKGKTKKRRESKKESSDILYTKTNSELSSKQLMRNHFLNVLHTIENHFNTQVTKKVMCYPTGVTTVLDTTRNVMY